MLHGKNTGELRDLLLPKGRILFQKADQADAAEIIEMTDDSVELRRIE